MPEIIIFALLCIFCSLIEGFAKAVRDTLDFHYYNSIFTKIKKDTKWWYFFNTPEVMSKNKYKDRDDVKRIPAFPGSTTILVFLTDGWHLSEFIIMLFNYVFAVSFVFVLYFYLFIKELNLYYSIPFMFLSIITSWAIRNSSFSLFFDKILIKKL